MLRVVVVGYGEMFTNLIAAALDANCNVVGILRGDTIKHTYFVKKIMDILNPSLEYSYIKSYNLHEIEANGVNTEEFRNALIKLNPDIVLVGSWGEKFSKETYCIPKIATINAHPSLLPKYRGPNPYFWVVKNREPVSGVTLHLMDDGFDTGAILAQEEVKVYPHDTGKTLKERIVLAARGVTCELLKDLSEDVIIPLQQREDRATYFSYPKGLELDFSQTAEENYALIRASYPWENTYFFHNITAFIPDYKNVLIQDNMTAFSEPGTVVELDIESKTIGVLCSDNKVLRMSNLSLLKKQDRFFTKNYLKLDVKVGDVIF